MIAAEVSLYPVESPDSDEVIMDSLKALDEYQLQYNVGSLNTHVAGEPAEVWEALQSLYNSAQTAESEIVMVVTISNGE